MLLALLCGDALRAFRGFQVREEPVDDRRGLLVVRESLADDAGGKVNCKRADFGPQAHQRALPLGFDLGLSLRCHAGRLSLSLLAEFGEDLSSVGASGLTDLRGLCPSVGQLCRIFGQRSIRFGLGAVRLGDVAFDGLRAGIEQFA